MIKFLKGLILFIIIITYLILVKVIWVCWGVSGTAFAIGCATFFSDKSFRNKLLRTAEITGHTIKWNDERHYLLANLALVGEAITLAMRTNYKHSFI